MSSRHLLPLLLLLLVAFLPGNLTALLPPCLPSQSSALLELKSGFASHSLESWKRGTNCCSWDGVTCDATSGMVTALLLPNRSISGNLSTALFNLTALEDLNLSYNLFDPSPLPPSGFERLANLTHLNLSNAGFADQIPIGIVKLHNLVSLDLSTFVLNEVSSDSLKLHDPDLGTLLGGLPNLKELYLDGVNISANGSQWCKAVSDAVPGLKVLSLTGCSLSGPIDDSLSRLDLSVLHLDQNNLSSTVPEFFGNFSSLTVLRLSFCELRGLFPNSVFQLENLMVLDLSSNPMLSGQLPDFPATSALQRLLLPDTNFSGRLPNSIGNLRNLTKLELTSCQFSGPIPSSVSNLTKLVHLDLSLNGFMGAIPSIALWTRITVIILAHNGLNGPIPSFGNGQLQSLTKVDLRDNSLTGSIPMSLFSLPSLQLLQLNLNKLSGHLVEFSIVSSSLITLDLSSNKLDGQIPSSIFKLTRLEYLALGWNNFSGTVELQSFRRLVNLSTLDLSSNTLSVLEGDSNTSMAFPPITTLKLVSCNLTKLPGFLKNKGSMINFLDLSNNRIGGIIPKWIWSTGNVSLTYLNLSYNLFTHVEGPLPDLSMNPSMILDLHSNLLQGPIPPLLQNTIVLDYSNNYFSSIPPIIFSYLTFTRFFSLSNNSLKGEIPTSICNATYLQVLDLSNNNFSGAIPQCLIEGGNDLRVLNLRGNQFEGTLPQNFNEGCILLTINLNGNRLEGQIPWSLLNCKTLEVLDLGNNQIVDSFPFWLGNLSALRVLVLRSNRFSGHIEHPSISNGGNYTFPTLQILDISSNNFSGSLSAKWFKTLKAMMVHPEVADPTFGYKYLQFGSLFYQDSVMVTSKGMDMTLVKVLTVYTAIDISKNRFQGDIPEVIGGLKSLYMLNMSHNSLAGGIPKALGGLMQLESLDLSFNQLSGEIPQQLTSLTFLAVLNLSYNNLSGGIPQSSQFSTFSSNSFEGNEGLCGNPLAKNCSLSLNPSSESRGAALKSVLDANWQFIFVGLGFGGGLAVVFGPLLMFKTWRISYNERVDRLFWAIVSLFWVCDICREEKVVAAEEEDVEMEEDMVHGRKFCVFCTKLDFPEDKMVIHHVACSCP